MRATDEADAAHVGREVVDLVHVLDGDGAIVPHAKIDLHEVVRGRGFVLRELDVGPADPIALVDEAFHEMVSDETTGPGHKYLFHDRQPLFNACRQKNCMIAECIGRNLEG